MTLAELLSGRDVRVLGGTTQTITGLSYDSRGTQPGDFFFATARDLRSAQTHVEQALNRGARAAAVRNWDREAHSTATIIECPQLRALMGVVAARFFGGPSRALDLIGVTGTSGKTTTTYLLRSILEAAGRPAAIIGTVGIFVGERKLSSGLTTPEAIDLEGVLAAMRRDGVSTVAAEISSIGLEERRVDELNFRACVFTNLGRDHLDYHGTLEKYFAAKLRLFEELLPRSIHSNAIAAVNGDDPYGQRVLDATHGGKISFGLGAKLEARAISARVGANGIEATLVIRGKRFKVRSPLLGEINLRNILGASAVSVALGIETDAVVEGVRRCPGAPGRLEHVSGPPGVTVLVDYAHKPDALAAVLGALRALEPRRLICVFGCGGDRDRGKRPLMGEIAGRLADVPIVTSDNPRTEEPQRIIDEIEAGMRTTALERIDPQRARTASGYLIEPDRRAAIALGLRVAAPGDFLLIAGKGHEDYQLIGGRRLDFDDRVVVHEETAALGA